MDDGDRGAKEHRQGEKNTRRRGSSRRQISVSWVCNGPQRGHILAGISIPLMECLRSLRPVFGGGRDDEIENRDYPLGRIRWLGRRDCCCLSPRRDRYYYTNQSRERGRNEQELVAGRGGDREDGGDDIRKKVHASATRDNHGTNNSQSDQILSFLFTLLLKS